MGRPGWGRRRDEVGGAGFGVVDDEDVGAVGVTDGLGGDHRSRVAAGDDLAVGDQVDGVAEQGGQAQVVQGGQHGDAEPGDELQHLDLVADVEVVGGFVEDEMVGALGEGPGDEHPLFLAAGEGVEAAAGQMLATDPVDGLGGDAPVGVVVAFERPLVRGAADHHHLEDGEVELDGRLLGDHGHPAGRVFGRMAQQVGRRRAGSARSAGRWTR